MKLGSFRVAALYTVSVLSSAGSAAGPEFVPNPRQAFEGFVAINAPRAEVPVGALWIDGYGPTGDAAAADNVETVRSLNGVTIDKGLQLAMTAGLFSLLGIEPRLRDRYSAKFTDLTIVRVKDVGRLSGPRGEPRIVEALKAASITVSTEGEIGLNARTIGWELRNVEGSTANGRTRNYAIEGRDLFVAFRVATPTLVTGKERVIEITEIKANEGRARLDNYLIGVRAECELEVAAGCTPTGYTVAKLSSYPATMPAEQSSPNNEGEAKLALPVPVADEQGGLFDGVSVRWVAPCARTKVRHCGREPRLLARFVGTRLEEFKSPQAKGW